MKKIKFVICLLGATLLLLNECSSTKTVEEKPLNILLITLDDMGYGTTGVEGCPVPGITPNIDKLASEGLLFTHGFVMTPICGPSRSAMLSGRDPLQWDTKISEHLDGCCPALPEWSTPGIIS